jgi:hypothetical protein
VETGEAPPERKDRLVQTRVPQDLELRVKQAARRRRVSVSQLVRDLLDETVDLVDGVLESVDDIVADSLHLTHQVRTNARRLARAAKRGGRSETSQTGAQDEEPDRPRAPTAGRTSGGTPESLSHVDAWNPVILNRPATCSSCGSPLARGESGYMGLGSKAGRPTAWLCQRCIEEIS